MTTPRHRRIKFPFDGWSLVSPDTMRLQEPHSWPGVMLVERLARQKAQETTTQGMTMSQHHLATFRYALGTRVTGYAMDATYPRCGIIAQQRATWRDSGLGVIVEYGVLWNGWAVVTWEHEADLAESEP